VLRSLDTAGRGRSIDRAGSERNPALIQLAAIKFQKFRESRCDHRGRDLDFQFGRAFCAAFTPMVG
jgi:hypothetical protein